MITCPFDGCQLTVVSLSTIYLHLFLSSRDRHVHAPIHARLDHWANGDADMFHFTTSDTYRIIVTISCDLVLLLVPNGSMVEQKQQVAKICRFKSSLVKVKVLDAFPLFVLNETRAESNTQLDGFFSKIILITTNTAFEACNVVSDCLFKESIPNVVLCSGPNTDVELGRLLSNRAFVLDMRSFEPGRELLAHDEAALLNIYPNHVFLLNHCMKLKVLQVGTNTIHSEVCKKNATYAMLVINRRTTNAKVVANLAKKFTQFALLTISTCL